MKNYFYDLLPFEVQEYIMELVQIKSDWDMVMIDLLVSISHEITKDGKGSVILSWIERGKHRAPVITMYHIDSAYPVSKSWNMGL